MSTPHNSDQTEMQLLSNYRDETPVEAVVTTVAETTGQSPVEMTPLAKVIDTDALNELFCGSEENPSSIAVTFDYCGQRVRVMSHGVQIAAPNSSGE